MVNIGINGFGRIGKCMFLQLLNHKYINVKAINIPGFNIKYLETYLLNDSTHHYDKKWDLKIIDNTTFSINNKVVNILDNRDASQLNWKQYDIEYVVDATGVYLTQEQAEKHNVDYVIMCAPPKDNTPCFVMNGNHEDYNGESIVSNASCTTNSIIPVLTYLHKNYTIENANFTTIHATTASQNTIDTCKFKNRTCRSILNNIIPHSTGASSSIGKIIPDLKGKIFGTSIRIPTSNVSLVDLNVQLKKETTMDCLLNNFNETPFLQLENSSYLVSSDFNTTHCPSIIDGNASMQMNNNSFKLMIWYDNEWSYTAKTIELLQHMYNINKNQQENKYFIENYNFKNERTILRLDWNVPLNNEGCIIDDFRITSSFETIGYILQQNPNYLIIVSHLGRPKNRDSCFSLKNIYNQIKVNFELHFDCEFIFLESGIHIDSMKQIKFDNGNLKKKVFLMENIRFHDEETQTIVSPDFISLYKSFGTIFVNDAFACSHRQHKSIMIGENEKRCYGYLINKEIKCLSSLVKNINNDKVLAIIGGAKMDDKLPLLESLSKQIDGIYIAGGNINSILKEEKYSSYINSIQKNSAKIFMMKDGLSSVSIDNANNPTYTTTTQLKEGENFYDIGMQSIVDLNNLINNYDIIFWNGTLGVVENEKYSNGSTTLMNILMNSNKKVIIGGGDTAGFVNKFKHNFYYVSTGGGASLEYLSKHELEGLKIYE